MAESSEECFNIGSTVNCKTCFNEEVQGEVVAFDPLINTILLKTVATSGKSSACDIMFVNLQYTSHVNVVKEAPSTQLPPLPSLNLDRLTHRVRKSIDEKAKLLKAMQSGGTVEGQRLFLTIGKTMDEVTWSGPNIVVMNQVMISPPYTLDHVKEFKEGKDANSKAVSHVRKIVEKFYKDQQSVNAPTTTAVSAQVQQISQ